MSPSSPPGRTRRSSSGLGAAVSSRWPGEQEARADDAAQADLVGLGVAHHLDRQQILAFVGDAVGQVEEERHTEAAAGGADGAAVDPDARFVLDAADEEPDGLTGGVPSAG